MKTLKLLIMLSILCFCLPLTVSAAETTTGTAFVEKGTVLLGEVGETVKEFTETVKYLLNEGKLKPYKTSIYLFGLLVIFAIVALIILKWRF